MAGRLRSTAPAKRSPPAREVTTFGVSRTTHHASAPPTMGPDATTANASGPPPRDSATPVRARATRWRTCAPPAAARAGPRRRRCRSCRRRRARGGSRAARLRFRASCRGAGGVLGEPGPEPIAYRAADTAEGREAVDRAAGRGRGVLQAPLEPAGPGREREPSLAGLGED